MKHLYACCAILISAFTFGNEFPNMEEFYKNPDNEKKLTAPHITKYLDAMKENINTECLKNNEESTCNCTADFLNKISVRELYYESIVSSQIFYAKVEAVRAKDDEKKKQLDAFSASRDSLDKKLLTACPGVK